MPRILVILVNLFLATTIVSAAETKDERDARMGWWREAKFGMFIHWGVYSVPAGVWKGTNIPSLGEWIMNKAKIPMADYRKLPAQFNPVQFNADEWVSMAKNAGMKYIVITSKHHDGFAMFHSWANPFNIYDATPFKRDPLAELAVACRKQGIRLGFYYSQAQDWNNGGAASGGKWDEAQTRNMDDYIDNVAMPQVREILSNYGADTPAVLWWDTPTDMNAARAKRLFDLVEQLKPGVIMNNRLLQDDRRHPEFSGDTETPEQRIPAQGYTNRDWETCMTMNDTWGFKSNDNNWKSTETLIRNLCDIASKGGNFLLNVGPTSDGLIPKQSVARLSEVGDWMKVNGEAIYGTKATPFDAPNPPTAWRCTSKPGKLYLMIFNWPTEKFQLPRLRSKVTSAYLLADPTHAKLAVEQTDATGVSIQLPAAAPDANASVVCLELADQVARIAP